MEIPELQPGPLKLVAPHIQLAAAAGTGASPGDGARVHQARPHLHRGCAGWVPVHQCAWPQCVSGGRQRGRVQSPGWPHSQHPHQLLDFDDRTFFGVIRNRMEKTFWSIGLLDSLSNAMPQLDNCHYTTLTFSLTWSFSPSQLWKWNEWQGMNGWKSRIWSFSIFSLQSNCKLGYCICSKKMLSPIDITTSTSLLSLAMS